MPISVGDRLPDATFRVMTSDGPANKSTQEIFGGKKVVLFAVPGAFTPSCHAKHLPGFLAKIDDFKTKGVDSVACLSVNDVFVLDAWSKASGADGKIQFLSDGNGTFTKTIGLDFDASAAGLGTRSRRYAMLVEDGVVKALNVEEVPSKVEASSADRLLQSL